MNDPNETANLRLEQHNIRLARSFSSGGGGVFETITFYLGYMQVYYNRERFKSSQFIT